MKLRAIIIFIFLFISSHSFASQFCEAFKPVSDSIVELEQASFQFFQNTAELSVDDYRVYTNLNLSAGINIDNQFKDYFSQENYEKKNPGNFFQISFSVDLTEIHFGIFGLSISLGAEYGFSNFNSSNNKNTLVKEEQNKIITIYTPEICFLYEIFPDLTLATGLCFTQSWYKNKQTIGENSTNTLIYSMGLGIPVKIRYVLFDRIGFSASYTFLLHPWIPDENKRDTKKDIVHRINVGMTYMIPSKRF
ncbi:MAG: hypothetical protein MJ188_00445 [Treponema sp.]|nr:hypothetical protein [Treponema sp.]